MQPACVRVIRVFAQKVVGGGGRRGEPTPIDASARAGDVCSREPLVLFDVGRGGRGRRVRSTVASPHRITAAFSSCLPSFPLPAFLSACLPACLPSVFSSEFL